MNSIAIIISAAVFFAWIALGTIWCIIDSKRYKKYIDSIEIGDLIGGGVTFNDVVNPFEERRKPIIVEITDIKTNEIGEKYVQYRYIGDPPYLTFNNKIDIFTELFCKTF